MTLRIDIVDKRLTGGRLTISARTTSKVVRRKREAAVRTLLDKGLVPVIDALRGGTLRIEEVERMVGDGDFDALRRTAAKSDPNPVTLGPHLERTMKTIEATLEPETVRQYAIIQRALVAHFGDGFDMPSLTREMAERFLHEPKATTGGAPWSAARQELAVALCGRFWKEAIEREAEASELSGLSPRLTKNPWRKASIPQKRVARVEYLQPEDWRAVEERAWGFPWALFLGLGAYAGVRMMEAANLRPGIDVDLDAREIHVQPRQGEHAWRPKTDRSVRTIPMGDALYRLLEHHAEAGYMGNRYLIRLPGEDRPVSDSTLTNWTRDAFRAAGLKYGRKKEAVTYHSLRHSFASWMIQGDGVDPRTAVSPLVVAQLLGDTLMMVERVYGHLAPKNYRDAVAVIDRRFGVKNEAPPAIPPVANL